MVLSLPILMPLDMIGGINRDGIGQFNIGNINQKWRLWFHLALTYIFSISAILLLWREMDEFIRRRHAFLMSDKHRKTPQSTTILVTGIPKGLNNEEALFNIFDPFPGGVTKVWLNRHPKNLMKLCKERDSVVKKLEMAECNYIRSAYGVDYKKSRELKEPQRPMGKVSKIPCAGQKVDLVDFYTARLCQLNSLIKEAQKVGNIDSLNSAFIQFSNQFAAQTAVQTIIHPSPFKMANIHSEISPLDVVWDNMNIDTLTKKGRQLVIFVVSTAMILLWTIPTIIVSSIASISDIVNTFKFLAFLQDLPSGLLGVIQGIFPPLLLSGLMALLPVLLTVMATYEGHVRQSSISLSVMSKYFFFLVVNVLLISTLSGGILKTIEELKVEGFTFDSVIRRFSEKLPEASTFFVTYVLLRGFTGPALELLQVVPLLLNFLFTHWLVKSPRQIWGVQGSLEAVNYGTLFPPQTLMFCIGSLYSTIAPPILPFVTFYFTMYYFVYRHQFLYVYLQPVETGGLAFPTAVKQAFTGIFISQITLFGIFLMKEAVFNDPAIPQLVLIAILIIITSLAFSNMSEAFRPLVTFLPVALFSKELSVDKQGMVTNGDMKRKNPNIQDEEQGNPKDKEVVVDMDNISEYSLSSIPLSEIRPQFQMTTQVYDNGCGTTNMEPLKHERKSLTFDNNNNNNNNRMPSNYSLPPPPTRGLTRPDLQLQSRSDGQLSFGRMSSFDQPVSFIHRHANNRPTSSIGFSEYGAEKHENEEMAEKSAKDAELERLQDQAYCHPAIYNVQKPVWLPMDERGVVQSEIDRLRSQDILVATNGAVLDGMTAKARVAGIICAPGEETRYRLERGE
ncbi:hypothetical protein BGZ46_002334 [Entomortierella lignicola]|nr:hypothetical protein BGZ46_002334 [Entomortierella lignicola]